MRERASVKLLVWVSVAFLSVASGAVAEHDFGGIVRLRIGIDLDRQIHVVQDAERRSGDGAAVDDRDGVGDIPATISIGAGVGCSIPAWDIVNTAEIQPDVADPEADANDNDSASMTVVRPSPLPSAARKGNVSSESVKCPMLQ